MTLFSKILNFEKLFLLLILLFAFLVRVYNLNFNSAFLDEAMYVVIGQKILEGRIMENLDAVSWVGGFPFVYPPVSAIFYNFGGLLATRLFNVFLGTVCVFLIYNFTKKLNLFSDEKSNEKVGLFSALLFSISAIPIDLSRVAIYDGLGFTFFLAGLNLYIGAMKKNHSFEYLLASEVFFTSFLVKYISLIFFPFLYLLALISSTDKIKLIKFFFIPLLTFLILYFAFNFQKLIEYFSSQVSNPATTYLDVLKTFLKYLWPAFVLSIGGALYLFKTAGKTVAILFMLSLVSILLHVLTRNDNSSHQHSVYSLIFLLPLAASLLVFLVQKIKIIGTVVVIFILFFNLIYSYRQVIDLETFWPNSEKAVSLLNEKITPDDIILAEGGDSILIGLKDFPRDNLIAAFVFNYQDKEGEEAYLKAVEDKYFSFIELENVYFTTELTKKIENSLEGRYEKILDDGRIRVYERI
jgi:hypothetical protein